MMMFINQSPNLFIDSYTAEENINSNKDNNLEMFTL